MQSKVKLKIKKAKLKSELQSTTPFLILPF